MTRRHYLITYDISGDKRRTAVFKTLIGQGDHVQYSVFLCALNPQELAGLRATLDQTIHHGEDQVIIVDLGRAENDVDLVLECLGKRYNPMTRVRIV